MPSRILSFYKEVKLSSLLQCLRYSLLGIFGEKESELRARILLKTLQQQQRHPLVHVLLNSLQKHLNHPFWHQARLAPFLQNIQRNGIAFQQEKDDPDVIVQIKKIIHILELAEQVLLVIEQIDEEASFFNLLKGLDCIDTTEKIYEICKLLMWPDVDLIFEFEKEWRFLLLCVEPLYDFFSRPNALESSIENFKESGNYLFELLGYSTDALTYPLHTDLLFQMKQILPEYLEQWRLSFELLVQSRAEDRSARSPILTLEEHFLIWISPLERLFKESFFRFGFLQDMLETLRNGHRLAWSICYDLPPLQADHQKLVQSKLNQFRLEFCLPFLVFLDKVEEKFILYPGVLTDDVIYRLDCLFETLSNVAMRVISLPQEERLLSTQAFLRQRLECLYQRQSDLNKKSTVLYQKGRSASYIDANRLFLLSVNQDIVNHIYKKWPMMRGVSFDKMSSKNEIFLYCRSFPLDRDFLVNLSRFFMEKSVSFQSGFHPVVQPQLKVHPPSFQERVVHQLTFSFNDIPYPEILEPKNALKTPQSILWIKQLANVFAHLSHGLSQLSLLDIDKSHDTETQPFLKSCFVKTILVTRIGLIEHHFRQVLWGMMDLHQQGYWHHLYQAHRVRIKASSGLLQHMLPVQNILHFKTLQEEGMRLFRESVPGEYSFTQILAWVDFGLKNRNWLLSTTVYDWDALLQKKKAFVSFWGLILNEVDALEEGFLLREGTLSDSIEQWMMHFQKFISEFSWPNLREEIRVERLNLLEKRENLSQKEQRNVQNKLENAIRIEKALKQLNIPRITKSDLALFLQTHSLSFELMITLLNDAYTRCEVAYREISSEKNLVSFLNIENMQDTLSVDVLKALMEVCLRHFEGVLQGEHILNEVRATKASHLKKEAQFRFGPSRADGELLHVRQAVSHFKRYIETQKKWLQERPVTASFESASTLQKKSNCLKRIEDILNNNSFSVAFKRRILTQTLEKPSFKRDMLAYHRYNTLGWAWLSQCFWRFLQMIGLYTPTQQSLYQNLLNQVCEITPAKNRAPRFFATSRKQNFVDGLYSYITTSL